MVFLLVWLAIFVFSIKQISNATRRAYRIRVKSSSNGWKTVLFSILAHLSFTQLFSFPVTVWIYWVFPVLNVLFVIHILLILDLVLDRYSVVDTARFTRHSIVPFLASVTGFTILLYYSVHLNDAIFSGICITALSIGLTGFQVTYRNSK
ncbi:hypothetical protein VTO7225_02982 [Vibrio toranzoniae]|nr:hypothetical protein VTO7225_02982 [Vibrio toranzoniae]